MTVTTASLMSEAFAATKSYAAEGGRPEISCNSLKRMVGERGSTVRRDFSLRLGRR